MEGCQSCPHSFCSHGVETKGEWFATDPSLKKILTDLHRSDEEEEQKRIEITKDLMAHLMRERDDDMDIFRMAHYYFTYRTQLWLLRNKLRKICDQWDNKLLVDWAESHESQRVRYSEAYAQDEDLFDQMDRLAVDKAQYDDLIKPKIDETFQQLSGVILGKENDSPTIISAQNVCQNFSELNVALFHAVQCLLKITDDCKLLDWGCSRDKYQGDIIYEVEYFFDEMPQRDFFNILRFPYWLEEDRK